MPASAVSRRAAPTATNPGIDGVPARNRATPSAGSYGRSMANWSRWPNQPCTGLRSRVLVLGADVEERRCAGAGVQVLVGAADGQVGTVALEGDRDRTRRCG